MTTQSEQLIRKISSYRLKLPIVFALCVLCFSYGILVSAYKVFPYNQIKLVKAYVTNSDCEFCGANPKLQDRLAQFRAFPSKATNVMVGDSITHIAHWKEMFPNYSILNRGIGYDKTTDILNRLDTIFSASPKRVFLMMGVNDFNLANRSVTEVYDAYIEVVQNIIKKSEIDIIIQSTIECADCGDITVKTRKLNTLLKDYAVKNYLTFIDLNALLSDQNGLKPAYQQNGIHPNLEGYKVWASAIKPLLK